MSRFKKFFRFLGIFVFTVFVLSRVNWLWVMEKTLVVQDPLKKADYLIVPSGAYVEERILEAARLYKEGYAPRVLLSGHMALNEETGVDVMKLYAVKLGIPENVISRESHSDVTLANAVESWKLLKNEKIDSVLIVTSPHHTRRARLLYRKVFPENIEIRVAHPAIKQSLEPWYRNNIRVRSAFHEYLSFLWLYTAQAGPQGGWE